MSADPGDELVPIDEAVDVTAQSIYESVVHRIINGSPAEAQDAVDTLDAVVEERRKRTGVSVWKVHPS